MTSEKLKEAVKKAEEAAAGTSDPELRKIAFDRVLSRLLGGDPGGQSPSQSASAAPRTPRTGRAVHPSVRKGGPKAWLEEMIADGYFKKQKTMDQILERLAENGHHLKSGGITFQLQSLLHERKLRRTKVQEKVKGRKVWAYSNW